MQIGSFTLLFLFFANVGWAFLSSVIPSQWKDSFRKRKTKKERRLFNWSWSIFGVLLLVVFGLSYMAQEGSIDQRQDDYNNAVKSMSESVTTTVATSIGHESEILEAKLEVLDHHISSIPPKEMERQNNKAMKVTPPSEDKWQ